MQQDLFSSTDTRLDLPNADVFYFRHFFEEHQQTYQQLVDTIEWQQDNIRMHGKTMPIPRLNAWYGDVDAAYSYSGINLTPKPWLPLLLELKNSIEEFLNSEASPLALNHSVCFNSVLANHYRDGNDSVSWHSDNEPELGENPLIASASFGVERRFSLRDRQHKMAPFHIDLAGGSLLIMGGATQHNWIHQLPKNKRVVDGRVNLTFRNILT